MAFPDRMKEARLAAGMTQEKLAQAIGVAKSTYTGYEKGNSEPNILIQTRIMEVLGVDANFLFQDEVKHHKDITASPWEMEHLVKRYRLLDPYGKEAVDGVLDVEWRRCTTEVGVARRDQMEGGEMIEIIRFSIPGYSLPLSAGTGQEAGEEYPENYTLVKEPPRGTSFIARVSGDSMEPTYYDGDLVFVHAIEEIPVGKIGAFHMDGQQWVKELGDGVLISHNPVYAPRPMTEDIRCQGLVLGVCDENYFE